MAVVVLIGFQAAASSKSKGMSSAGGGVRLGANPPPATNGIIRLRVLG